MSIVLALFFVLLGFHSVYCFLFFIFLYFMQPLFLFPLTHRYFVLSLFRFFILLDFQLIIVLVIGLGVSGGTASGKTTVCDMIIQQLHDHRVVLVNQVSPARLSVANIFTWPLSYHFPVCLMW